MKWTSFTQLRMEIIKTIKNRELTICNHQPSQPQRRLTMKNSKNIKTTRRRKQTLYDKKQYYIK